MVKQTWKCDDFEWDKRSCSPPTQFFNSVERISESAGVVQLENGRWRVSYARWIRSQSDIYLILHKSAYRRWWYVGFQGLLQKNSLFEKRNLKNHRWVACLQRTTLHWEHKKLEGKGQTQSRISSLLMFHAYVKVETKVAISRCRKSRPSCNHFQLAVTIASGISKQ